MKPESHELLSSRPPESDLLSVFEINQSRETLHSILGLNLFVRLQVDISQFY